ncbi:MAG: hypothetical protein LUC22_04965 [Prevotella sp.]|nr:hypothetical protein [Prevotella sp.]
MKHYIKPEITSIPMTCTLLSSFSALHATGSDKDALSKAGAFIAEDEDTDEVCFW